MSKRRISLYGFLALIVGGQLLAACSGNPVQPDRETDHADAFGIMLRAEADTLYAYSAIDGSVACSTGPCDIVGVVGTALPIDVLIVDRDGEPIPAGDLAADFDLEGIVADTSIATGAVAVSGQMYRLTLTMRREGETRMRLALLHGGEHEDLGTPPLEDERAIRVRVGR